MEFIPYEYALELKELGFDEPCFGYYLCRNSTFGIDDLFITTEWIDLLPYDSSSCKAPLYQQAFRWFRENYGLCQIVYQNTEVDWTYDIVPTKGARNYKLIDVFDTYEEAELACLIKLIEIINNANKN
jgi:hypothetical protein